LTGAGISVESGIPPFRGKGGLWEKIDPMEVAHIDAFMEDPARVWRLLIQDLGHQLASARPNDAHHGLAALENLGCMTSIITQNVDGLHQAAGSSRVVEFHGTFATVSCLKCHARQPIKNCLTGELPPLCDCGGVLRPDCVFFGEMIPTKAFQAAQVAVATCDVMLVVGTSATVQPAAHMPVMAKQNGAVIIEINPEATPLSHSISDYMIKGPAGVSMRRLTAAVAKMRSNVS
jgi:NAD-dependent deacetylase